MRNPSRLTILLAWSSAVVLWACPTAASAGAGGGRVPSPNPVHNPPLDDIARGRNQACSATSRAASRACAGDVDDEYWTSVGKCQNIADADARQQCLDEARVAMD